MHGLDGYPRYVWITYSWYQDRWWRPVINNDPIRCDEEDLVQLLKRSLILGIVPFPDDPDASTDVGQVRVREHKTLMFILVRKGYFSFQLRFRVSHAATN